MLNVKKFNTGFVAEASASEEAGMSVHIVTAGDLAAVGLMAYDPDEGPQGCLISVAHNQYDVRTNVRTCLADVAHWAVTHLSGWDAREALEAVGEAMEVLH